MKAFVPQFYGKVTGGKLILLHQKEYDRYIKKFEGKDIFVIIEKATDIRTLKQNRRHFGALITAIADHTGESKHKIHAIAKDKFLRDWDTFQGKAIEITRSSTVLDKDEFNKFMDSVEEWARDEFEIYIDPKYK